MWDRITHHPIIETLWSTDSLSALAGAYTLLLSTLLASASSC